MDKIEFSDRKIISAMAKFEFCDPLIHDAEFDFSHGLDILALAYIKFSYG